MIRKRKVKKSKSNAIGVSYDGIDFKSKIERSMYRLLKINGLETNYEKENFILEESFTFPNVCWERQMNGKGDFSEKTNSKINQIKYTPDFTGKDFIIEVKGWASPRFAVVWRLFKKHLFNTKDNRMLFKPQSLKDCTEVVELIKQKRLNDKKKNKSTKIK